MIKAVVFDYGGVLSRFGVVGDSAKRYATTLGCDPSRVGPLIGPLIGQWCSGRLDTPEFWKAAALKVGAPERNYGAVWRLNEPHRLEHSYYELAESLRRKGLITGIISNINPASAQLIRTSGGYRGFDPVVLSFEAGSQKPQPAIFRHLLRELGLMGSEVLLVDDQPVNLVAAARFDIRGIEAHDPRQTIQLINASL